MNKEYYHNIKNNPFAERETFNNTIILLTMIKSKYYYIVGFSGLDSIIEIAFDFESELHSKISEQMTVDFGSDKDYVLIRSELCNISAANAYLPKQGESEGKFSLSDDKVVYNYRLQKDKLIPKSIEQMNKYILKAKSEIITYLETCYEKYLS